VYLYSAPASLLIEDVLLNRIAEKLKVSFADQLNRKVSPAEMNAWRNSLQSFAHVLSHYQLTNVAVVLEMQLPLTSKWLDCLLTGTDQSGRLDPFMREIGSILSNQIQPWPLMQRRYTVLAKGGLWREYL
jgi:hypothetical protein